MQAVRTSFTLAALGVVSVNNRCAPRSMRQGLVAEVTAEDRGVEGLRCCVLVFL